MHGGSTPGGDLSTPFFRNRQCTFETVPIEAGQNSCSWNFYKLAVQEQEEENGVRILRRGICSILPIFPAGFQHSDLWVLIYLKDKSLKEIHQKDSTGRERTKNIWKNEACDVMLEAVLDTAWGKILMSAFGTHTFRKFKTMESTRCIYFTFLFVCSCNGYGSQEIQLDIPTFTN